MEKLSEMRGRVVEVMDGGESDHLAQLMQGVTALVGYFQQAYRQVEWEQAGAKE
jgi:hypothetical protein